MNTLTRSPPGQVVNDEERKVVAMEQAVEKVRLHCCGPFFWGGQVVGGQRRSKV